MTGRMSQTSNERLREYLAQLPIQSQALLMREFERAIERGEDTAVASLVLEQLRNIVRRDVEDLRRAAVTCHDCSSARSIPLWSTATIRRDRAGSAGLRFSRSGTGSFGMALRSRRTNIKRPSRDRRNPGLRSNWRRASCRRLRPKPFSRSPGPAPVTTRARWPASARPM